MNVGQLKTCLANVPDDVQVHVSVKVKDGFYDVRSEWASAPAREFDYDKERKRVEISS